MELFSVSSLVALLTLLALAIVLGIDNVIFIAILTGKLPPDRQERARQMGIGLAVFSRILLLLAISWVIGLTRPLFEIMGHGISGRDLILLAGVMLVFAGTIARFVEKHPTMKILALAFLILIGVLLVIEGWNPEVVEEIGLKNYAYFAMVFAFLVEAVNMRLRRSEKPVDFHNRPHTPTEESAHPGPGQV